MKSLVNLFTTMMVTLRKLFRVGGFTCSHCRCIIPKGGRVVIEDGNIFCSSSCADEAYNCEYSRSDKRNTRITFVICAAINIYGIIMKNFSPFFIVVAVVGIWMFVLLADQEYVKNAEHR